MKAVFMDLQGTLGGDPLGDITSFEFYHNVKNGLKLLQDHGYRLIVITNQSRISKGFLTYGEYEDKKDKIIAEMRLCNIDPVEFYCCPHTDKDDCTCKKPKIGLFETANEKKSVDIAHSYMIGDMGMSDMVFAHNIGLKKILVLTGVGIGSVTDFRALWKNVDADFIADDFYHAALWITGKRND